MQKLERIAILDFGSQYTQLIARRIREMGVYTEILPPDASIETIFTHPTKGVILSGGARSIHDSPFSIDQSLFKQTSVPLLGICFGMQLMNARFKGKVCGLKQGEYGKQHISLDNRGALWGSLPKEQIVWMSHRDSIETLSPDFIPVAKSADGIIAAIQHKQYPFYGVQFHPEVTHTLQGKSILANFLELCRCNRSWSITNLIEQTKKEIKGQVEEGIVISLVSGGVDSTVSTFLCMQALGKDRVIPIHINNGFMRQNESEQVRNSLGLDNLVYIDASEPFLRALQGVTDSEQKRKIIGDLFVEVLEKEIHRLDLKHRKVFICQGTLYTDLIESGKGHADVIKSHHNVNSPLIEKKRKQGLIVEPNKHIFKDEVRFVSEKLNIPIHLHRRHPFPGPGLAIRIMGEVTIDRLNALRQADRIFLEEIEKSNLYDQIWQAFAVYLPVRSVGVMGDKRTVGHVIALRAVISSDGMTADFSKLPYPLLERASARIVNEVESINRVVYDITSKPPGTIEWE